MVVEGTELERWYRTGRYQPYDAAVMIDLLADIKAIVPKYVRISRVLRDIPPKYITGGPRDSLRGTVKQRMQEKDTSCECIRCREYGLRLRDGWEMGEPEIRRLDYNASGGQEIFLSFEDKNETLFGLLRMRIPARPGTGNKPALIRELHIYGPELSLSQRRTAAAQHKGLGKALLKEAERIAAAEFGAPRMVVLSGVGAREYYRSEFDYRLEGSYMTGELQA